MIWGINRNNFMDGVIVNKYSAQIPTANGSFGPEPADDQVVVFLIGAKSNQ
jgi:hypothetical protein